MAGLTVAPAPRAPSTFALRPRVLRTLLWLRWQLLLRGYSRSPSRIIGAVVLALFLIPVSGLMAFGLMAAFQNLLPDQELIAQNILFYLLTGLYLIYALLPLLQYNINESLDVTKLTTYPLSQPELMASLLISTLLDIPTLGVLLLFIGIGIGWAQSVTTGVVIGVVLVLAYVHLVAISQLLLSLMMGLLRSRRFRDISLVLITFLGLSCSLGSQLVSRLVPTQGDVSGALNFINFDVGPWLQFTPPGMAARAIVALYQGQPLAAGLWLLVLATPEQGGTSTRRRRAPKVAALPVGTTTVVSPLAVVTPTGRQIIPAPVLAIAQKDLHYYWRDPMYKRAFLGSLYLVGIILLNLFTLSSRRGGSGFSEVLVGAALFLVLNLTAYGFGYEGATITTLSLFPIRPAHLFVGRNLATLVVGVLELILLLALQGFVSQDWYQVSVLAMAGLGAIIAAMGPGNVMAVLFPIRMVRSGLGRQQSDSSSGCLTGLTSLLAYVVSLLLIAPIALLVFVPQWIGQPQYSLLLAPVGLLYGIAVYAGGTALAASQYYERLPHIIEVVTRE